MIYNIDRDNKTATVDFKYGGEEYFSYALGSFNYTKDNHKVFNSGWHFSDPTELDNPACTQFTNDKYDAFIIELDENNNELAKIRIDESKFEVIKAPIYDLAAVSVNPKENEVHSNYEFDKEGSYKSNLGDVAYEKLSESEALAYKQNTGTPITFFILNGRMTFDGMLLDSSELKVTLISPKGIAYRYSVKDKNSDEYRVINLTTLPKGRYYIYVNLNEYIYNTLQHVEI